MHPFVIGEIACGNLRSWPEVLPFLEQHRLFGAGITWIDAHLLASARLSTCRLWTLDARLRTAAAKLHLT